ncbi:hypothetical protein [Janibacter alittae]|uniref:Uncharacterized protein n=1 Tax=Janibacter alittae TaxID=3115209 RepID=A0ABZ2MEA2_9MICO
MSELVPFGHEQAWLAVRGQPQTVVVEALGLTGGRVVEVDEAVREALGSATAVLPPIPGAGSRWTLVVGEDVARPSAARITTLSAMLGTGVQLFHRAEDGSRRCLLVERGAVWREVEAAEDDLPGVAGEWSIDPTSLSGPAPGPALLVGALRSEPPTPDTEPGLVELPPRGGFWGRILGR